MPYLHDAWINETVWNKHPIFHRFGYHEFYMRILRSSFCWNKKQWISSRWSLGNYFKSRHCCWLKKRSFQERYMQGLYSISWIVIGLWNSRWTVYNNRRTFIENLWTFEWQKSFYWFGQWVFHKNGTIPQWFVRNERWIKTVYFTPYRSFVKIIFAEPFPSLIRPQG